MQACGDPPPEIVSEMQSDVKGLPSLPPMDEEEGDGGPDAKCPVQ
jgi:hypothetical protein